MDSFIRLLTWLESGIALDSGHSIFGGNASNATDKKMLLDKINDIGNNADKTIPGVFAGQGPNGTRSGVFFKIKGNDVVVTKPDGTFVTILKDGVNNTSVKNSLKGEPR